MTGLEDAVTAVLLEPPGGRTLRERVGAIVAAAAAEFGNDPGAAAARARLASAIRERDDMTQRWSATQHDVAGWYRMHGWQHAEPVGSGRAGRDVLGMPGLAPEVKAADEMRLRAWLKQAATTDGSLAYVVYRGRGDGPSTLPRWPVIMTLADHTALLQQAGYGSDGAKGSGAQ